MNAGKAAWRATVIAYVSMHAMAAFAHAPAGECSAPARQPQIEKARAELERTPALLAKRFELAELLTAAGCNDEAIHVLEAVEAANPHNSELRKRLRATRSLIDERQFFDGLDQAEIEARAARNRLRCTRFGDPPACDEALRTNPDDVELVVARGDAFLKAGQLMNSLATYRRAVALAPGDAAVSGKLAEAESRQRALHRQCTTEEGDQALAACQAVLVKDAPDEFDITRRIAVLYQHGNQLAKSLDFHIAANSLRRGDKSIALAVVALTESTGRSDAVALAALGSALITLGKPRDAMISLRQAQALTPGLPDVDNQIVAADRLIKQEDRLQESQRKAAPVAPAAAVVQTTYSNLEPPSQSH